MPRRREGILFSLRPFSLVPKMDLPRIFPLEPRMDSARRWLLDSRPIAATYSYRPCDARLSSYPLVAIRFSGCFTTRSS